MGEEGDDPDQHCGMEAQGALRSQVANLLVLLVHKWLICWCFSLLFLCQCNPCMWPMHRTSHR